MWQYDPDDNYSLENIGRVLLTADAELNEVYQTSS